MYPSRRGEPVRQVAIIFAVLACTVCARRQAGEARATVAPAAAPLIGDWRLLELVDKWAKAGTDYPLGWHPIGVISYSPTGRMSVQMMSQDTVPPPDGAPYVVAGTTLRRRASDHTS